MVVPGSIVLVEGVSDKRALEAFAARRGHDLEADRIAVVAMGGAQAIGRYLRRFGPQGLDVGLAGLCDIGEEPYFRRALERAGVGSGLDREAMEALGFFVCVDDLEDELTRSIGAAGVEQVIEAQGEAAAFRTFRKQLEKRGLTLEQQIHGFMWNRKLRYASHLVEALDLAHAPRPLDGVLAHVLNL